MSTQVPEAVGLSHNTRVHTVTDDQHYDQADHKVRSFPPRTMTNMYSSRVTTHFLKQSPSTLHVLKHCTQNKQTVVHTLVHICCGPSTLHPLLLRGTEKVCLKYNLHTLNCINNNTYNSNILHNKLKPFNLLGFQEQKNSLLTRNHKSHYNNSNMNRWTMNSFKSFIFHANFTPGMNPYRSLMMVLMFDSSKFM